MIGTLYRLELFKMVKRLANWVAYLTFMTLIIFTYGSIYYDSIKAKNGNVYFSFPNAWQLILELSAPVVGTFSAVLIVLLVSSEFDWRTSRQNIIDGLSKSQWFTAKLLLLPSVAMLTFGSQLLFAGTLVWLNTETVNLHTISGTQLLAMTGIMIGLLIYSSIALLVSLLVRNTGSALGITLIYQVFEVITTRTLRGFDLDRLADCFPFQVHLALIRYDQYLPVNAKARVHMEIFWDTPLLFIAGTSWITVLLILSWLVYWRRDL